MDIMMSMADTFLVAELDQKVHTCWRVKTRDALTGQEYTTHVSPTLFPSLLFLMAGGEGINKVDYADLEKCFEGAEGGCRPIP